MLPVRLHVHQFRRRPRVGAGPVDRHAVRFRRLAQPERQRQLALAEVPARRHHLAALLPAARLDDHPRPAPTPPPPARPPASTPTRAPTALTLLRRPSPTRRSRSQWLPVRFSLRNSRAGPPFAVSITSSAPSPSMSRYAQPRPTSGRA